MGKFLWRGGGGGWAIFTPKYLTSAENQIACYFFHLINMIFIIFSSWLLKELFSSWSKKLLCKSQGLQPIGKYTYAHCPELSSDRIHILLHLSVYSVLKHKCNIFSVLFLFVGLTTLETEVPQGSGSEAPLGGLGEKSLRSCLFFYYKKIALLNCDQKKCR